MCSFRVSLRRSGLELAKSFLARLLFANSSARETQPELRLTVFSFSERSQQGDRVLIGAAFDRSDSSGQNLVSHRGFSSSTMRK
jgi:hypothetical protein